MQKYKKMSNKKTCQF